MKYLVLFAVLFLVYLLWRHERRSGRQDEQDSAADAGRAAAPRAQPGLPQEMVRCSLCAVHLPRGDALDDRRGRYYCCAEHRLKDSA